MNKKLYLPQVCLESLTDAWVTQIPVQELSPRELLYIPPGTLSDHAQT